LLSEKAIADDRMRARWRNASANPQYTSYMKPKTEGVADRDGAIGVARHLLGQHD
jgi:hypothetical protein